MIRSLLFFLFLSVSLPCFSQFNDSTSYVLNYNTGGSVNKTDDSKTYLLNNALRLGIRKKTVSLNFNNKWVYGKQNQQLTNNDFSSSLDFNLYQTFPHFFFGDC